MSGPLKYDYRKLDGDPAEAPGLSSYLAGLYLPLAGGTIDGDLNILGLLMVGGNNVATLDDLAGYATTSYVDEEVNANGASLQAFASNANNLASGTVPIERLPTGTTGSSVALGNHTHTASQITDFNEAVDDELNNCLVAGTDVTLNYNDAANTLTIGLSNNVPRLNAANTFTANQSIAQNFYLISGGEILCGRDSSGVYIAGGLNTWLNGTVFVGNLSSTVRIVGGILTIGGDVQVRRNATGPTAELRAAGGARICNQDGSALAALACSQVTASTITSNQTGFSNAFVWGSGAFFARADGMISYPFWHSAGSNTVLTNGTFRVRNAADSADANATCANLTASGFVDGALRPFTVAGLPLASANTRKEYWVTDSTLAMTSANYGSTVSGGGSNGARVISNGTNWIIA